MKNIYNTLKKDLLTVRKEKKAESIKLLTFLLGEIDRAGKDHSDEAVTKILATVQKQLSKSAVPNELEISIIGAYLPKEMTHQDMMDYLYGFNPVDKSLGEVVKNLNEFAKANGNSVNGKLAVQLIKEFLGK